MFGKDGKRGFTLIEMLVVIAVIAILVTMIVPAVTGYRTRAAAATNAANLRSVEGQLSTLLVTNPEVLRNSFGQDFSEALTTIFNSISIIYEQTPNWRVQLALADAMLHLEDRLAENVFYGHDGEMRLNSMTIAAPTAKALSVDGITIYNRTEMEVVVGEGYIVATYAGMTADAFAAIAEGGEEGDYATTAHKYVDTNGDHVCDICKDEYSHTAAEKADGIIDNVISGGHTCTDTNRDHACDEGCGNTVGTHKIESVGGGKHMCNYCYQGEGTCSDAAGDDDHNCDVCGTRVSTSICADIEGDEDHNCDECGAGNITGHTYVEQNRKKICSECGHEDSCVTPDTLITLADGSQVRVDSLTGNEELLVWNMETGKLDTAPIMFIDSEREAEVEVIYLNFSDGTQVKVITEHGFWDLALDKYVYLGANAYEYVGHYFYKQTENGAKMVKLASVERKMETTTAWSPVTVGHLNYFVNGMLSMPGGVGGLFNIFDVDPNTMAYDAEAMARDIETYGLLTYEELSEMIPLSEDMFNAAGGAYLKVSMGKGNLTEEELTAMIERYSVYFE